MMDFALKLAGSILGAVTWQDLAAWWIGMTAIAALGHAILALTAKATAATRQMVALVSLGILAMFPMANTFLPRWSLAVLPSPSARTAPEVVSKFPTDDGAATAEAAARVAGPADARAAGATVAEARTPVRSAPWPWRAPSTALIGLFAISSLLMAKLGFGMLAAERLRREARPVDDPLLLRDLTRACEELQVWSWIEARTSQHASIPMVCGVFDHVILLPVEASSWSREKRRAVFLHEVAHVTRHDAAWLLVGRLVTALLWFHPLVWTLARVARRECERACDDVVLSRGIRASDYADHLLAIARAAGGAEVVGTALAFSRRSSLESRLVSLLRVDLRRGPASRGLIAATGLLLAVALLPLATVRVTAATDPEPPSARAAPTALQDETLQETKVEERKARKVLRTASMDVAEPLDAVSAEHKTADADARSGEAWFDQARDLYDRERYSEAAGAYERAARAGYRSATAWYNAACSHALAGRSQPALDALQQALDRGFDRVELLRHDSDLESIRSTQRYRTLLDQARHTDGAMAKRKSVVVDYQTLVESGSTQAEDWRAAGMALLRNDEPAKAADAFQREFRLDGRPNAIYNLACAQAVGGDANAALATLERAIAAGSGDGDMLRNDEDLVSLHRDARFDRLVELAEDLEIRHGGRSDEDESAWRREMPRYERVAQAHPRLGRAWFNLGYARLRAGDARGSLTAFQKSLDLDYRKPTTLYNLGCASAQIPDVDAALQWLKRAEDAGMRIGEIARDDRDLDPLRSDARFRAMEDRWEAARYQEKEKEKNKERWKKS